MNDKENKASNISRGVGWAILILMVPIAFRVIPDDILGPELGQRLLNCLLGLIVVGYANQVPKFLTPISKMKCNPSNEQRLRRFTAWTLVLGGIGYILCWMFVPLASASLASLAVLGSAVLLVTLRLILNKF